MSMYLSVSRPTGDVIIKPPCYWLVLCVLCVLELKLHFCTGFQTLNVCLFERRYTIY